MNNEKEIEMMNMGEKVNAWLKTPKAHVLEPERIKLLKMTCGKLQSILDAENAGCRVEVKPCPLGLGDAIISFEAADFVVRDMDKFCDAVRHLKNFEIYPCGNGAIHFSGIMPQVAKVVLLA